MRHRWVLVLLIVLSVGAHAQWLNFVVETAGFNDQTQLDRAHLSQAGARR